MTNKRLCWALFSLMLITLGTGLYLGDEFLEGISTGCAVALYFTLPEKKTEK